MMSLTLLFPNGSTDLHQHEKEQAERGTAMAQFALKPKTLPSSYLIVFPVIATCLWLSYIPFKPDFIPQRH